MTQSGAQSGSAISFVNFNQDHTCISVGTQRGFKIFNCEPFARCHSECAYQITSQPSNLLTEQMLIFF